MFLATQYYRPPFPNKKYWLDDFKKIKDTGLDAVQIWAIWGWIESDPGKFQFDDYDQLIELADKTGLNVIISTIAEIHPFWIHRIIPDSYMIDHRQQKVISSERRECNVGLTPGGCTDNPEVKKRMGQFLETIADRYKNLNHLIGWDIWNETRWAVHADGYVCYCEHTLKAFNTWLKDKYKDLQGLNSAWQKRYNSWEDVYPGKEPDRPYTKMIEFLRFISYRAKQHMKFRYEQIKQQDKNHFISAHCGTPAIESLGQDHEQALSRGNDWDFAEILDGFGCSHFPAWGHYDQSQFGIRLEAIRSANQGKPMWVSELQGGSARFGFIVSPSVNAKRQQQWIINGISKGAKGVIFWCWRDEIFGPESSGFGIIGNDGYAEHRIKKLKETNQFLKKNEAILKTYKPEQAKVGVLFNPDNYFLSWSQDSTAEKAGHSLLGYLMALEQMNIPYDVLEPDHIKDIDLYNFIILPWSLIIKKKTENTLIQFVKNGGTLLCEAEMDSFSNLGFYQYTGKNRSTAHQLNIKDFGRREIKQEQFTINYNKKKFKLKADQWLTPLSIDKNDKPLLEYEEKDKALAILKKTGKGNVLVLGTFFGTKYLQDPYPELKEFLNEIIKNTNSQSTVSINIKGDDQKIKYRTGFAGKNKMLYIINEGNDKECFIFLPKDIKEVYSLKDGTKYIIKDNKLSIKLSAQNWDVLIDMKK